MSRITTLLAQMTLEEKVGQLVQLSGEFFVDEPQLTVGPKAKLGISQQQVQCAGSVLNVSGAKKTRHIQEQHLQNSRLKIPLLFMADIVYGYRTVFPIPLALGCSWSPALIERCCQVAAKEAVSAGSHVTFAPMADLVRDARWGRCMESTGEDPLLNSRIVSACVRGFQHNLEHGEGLAACVKHFAGYGAPVAGRDYNTVELSRQSLFEDYLPPYLAAVQAGCKLVMTAFNTLDGIPATANRWLLNTLLRERWHFDGVTIADYAAVKELIPHGVAEDERHASQLAFNAGLDIDMKSPCYVNHLPALVKAGVISEDALDQAVTRVLQLKETLGLFDDPFRGASEEKERAWFYHPDHLALARETAARSLVLLKNDNALLPLKPGTKVALIGPYADNPDIIGLWAVYGETTHSVTLKQALDEVLAPDDLLTTQGCDLLLNYDFLGEFGATTQVDAQSCMSEEQRQTEQARALQYAREADVVLLAMGEHMMQSGEAASRTDIHLPHHQVAFIQAIARVAKKTVLILFNGRPLVLSDVVEHVDAVIEAWFPGSEGGHAIADVLYGKRNPSGRLAMSFPRANGQVPIYYNTLATGRPADKSDHSPRFISKYLDCPTTPLFPFGFGLSWHRVELSELTLAAQFVAGETLTVGLTVRNLTPHAGVETIQLYLQDCVASVARPIMMLKEFQQVALNAYETRRVIFAVNEEMLGFCNAEGENVIEAGRFNIFVGTSSVDVLEGEFIYRAG